MEGVKTNSKNSKFMPRHQLIRIVKGVYLTAVKQISVTVGTGSQSKLTREVVHFSGRGLSALQSYFCKLISVTTELSNCLKTIIEVTMMNELRS